MDKTSRVLNIKAESRKDPSSGKMYVDGMIPYNSRSLLISERGRQFFEVLAPSAFVRTLNAGTDVKMLWNHDANEVLGSRKAGTLTLENRADGLHFSCLLPDHAANRFETVSRGDVDGTSFSFQADVNGDAWAQTEDGMPLRTVTAAHLFEISPCTFPAYPGSSSEAATRSMPGEEPPEQPPAETPEDRRKAEEANLRKLQENEIALILAPLGL